MYSPLCNPVDHETSPLSPETISATINSERPNLADGTEGEGGGCVSSLLLTPGKCPEVLGTLLILIYLCFIYNPLKLSDYECNVCCELWVVWSFLPYGKVGITPL